MTFEEWFTERFSNPDDDCYIFSKIAWNAAIHEAIRQSTLPCRSGDAGRDRLPDDLSKLLTA